jgi:hypothetical protein
MFFIIKFSRFDDMRGVGDGEMGGQGDKGDCVIKGLF